MQQRAGNPGAKVALLIKENQTRLKVGIQCFSLSVGCTESGLPETSPLVHTRLSGADLRLLTLSSSGSLATGHLWLQRGSKYSASQMPRAKVVAAGCKCDLNGGGSVGGKDHGTIISSGEKLMKGGNEPVSPHAQLNARDPQF